VASYDVEYRTGGPNANWTPWLVGAADTAAEFILPPGQPIAFRVAAVDRVGNRGLSAEARPFGSELQSVKYYHLGGQRIAMRTQDTFNLQPSTLFYLSGDHLGSVSLTTDQNGGVVSESRYLPFGELRWESGAAQTDFGFTGQRAERSLGLMDYNARFYSPRLGRFVSADSVVPGMAPGAFDRYSYVVNNPIGYKDPSGHYRAESEACYDPGCEETQPPKLPSPKPENVIDLSEADIELLVLLIAMESSSGKVPDEVNYMKAWALLNKISFDIAHGKYTSAWNSWKNHERGLLDAYGVTPDKVSNMYNDYLEKGYMATLDDAVRQAVTAWQANGRFSDADPVHGAVGFTDLAGMRDDNGEQLQDRSDWDSTPNSISLNKDTIEKNWWRGHYTGKRYAAISDVYQVSEVFLVVDEADRKEAFPQYTCTFFMLGDGEY
jgi:RHS repeat-associated protein